jgi:hypothetical protein
VAVHGHDARTLVELRKPEDEWSLDCAVRVENNSHFITLLPLATRLESKRGQDPSRRLYLKNFASTSIPIHRPNILCRTCPPPGSKSILDWNEQRSQSSPIDQVSTREGEGDEL